MKYIPAVSSYFSNQFYNSMDNSRMIPKNNNIQLISNLHPTSHSVGSYNSTTDSSDNHPEIKQKRNSNQQPRNYNIKNNKQLLNKYNLNPLSSRIPKQKKILKN